MILFQVADYFELIDSFIAHKQFFRRNLVTLCFKVKHLMCNTASVEPLSKKDYMN